MPLRLLLFLLMMLTLTSMARAQGVPGACLCGDPNGDGTRTAADVSQLRAKLAGQIAEVSAPEKCSTIAPGTCNLRDSVVLRRALASLPPFVAPVCAAAAALACPSETTCPAHPLTPPSSGVCEQTASGGPALRVRGTILGPKSILRAGEVLIDETGRIACVGCNCATAPGGASAAVVTCAQGVVSPGLINALDHITFVANPPYVGTTERYEHRHQWRTGSDGHTEISVPGSATPAQIRAGELRQLLAGTTSMVGSGTGTGLVRNLDSATGSGLDLSVQYETFPLDDSAGLQISSGCAYPNIDDPAALGTRPYFPILAEGTAASARNEFVCMSQAPNDIFEGPFRVSPAPMIALRAPDPQKIRAAKAVVRWTPRYDAKLYANTAPVTLLDSSGVPLALGTQWAATGSSNLLRELRCAQTQNTQAFGQRFSDYDLWAMVTTNGAIATGMEPLIGTLRPGRVADLAVFDARVRADYRAVLEAEPGDVVLVMREGLALYGDATLMASPALGGGACEETSVCTRAKRACVSREFGGSPDFAMLQGELASYGGLFSCTTPTNEPSCALVRAGYPSGPTAGDLDGDGIANAPDLCPTIFAPIRPMDAGVQPNLDGDAFGDVCDPCPSDAGNTCVPPSPDDLDQDGVANGVDTCPTVADPAQLDGDGDGVGDACDPCGDPNAPWSTPCGVSLLPEVRNPADPDFVGFNRLVAVEDLYVTAVLPDGASTRTFFAQTSTLAVWNGITLTAPLDGPPVAIGDEISVVGDTINFSGSIQLTDVDVTVESSGPLPFGPLFVSDPASIATGGSLAAGLEGILLSVGPVSVVNQNPDSPSDLDQFAVTGNLRVDDRAFPTLDNVYLAGTQFASITGVLDLASNQNHLLPRSAADLSVVPGLVAVTPGSATVAPGDSVFYAVNLSAPAVGNVAVSLALEPAAVGTIPAFVVVPDGQQSVPFQFTAAAAEGAGTITATLGAASVQAQVLVQNAPSLAGLVINEVDYDNVGTDSAEFVEILNTSQSTISLANVVLVLVNGSSSTEYARFGLGSANSLAPGAYAVIGDAAARAAAPPGTLTIAIGTTAIQDGSPDGLALIHTASDFVFDVLSYEGSITAATITGQPGPVNLVEGTPAPEVDSNTVQGSLARVPDGIDTGNADADWVLSSTPTPGSANAP